MRGIVYTCIVGFIAGWLARYFMKARKRNLLVDIALGIGGAVAGSILFGLLGFGSHGLISDIIVAFVGAVVLIAIYRAITRR